MNFHSPLLGPIFNDASRDQRGFSPAALQLAKDSITTVHTQAAWVATKHPYGVLDEYGGQILGIKPVCHTEDDAWAVLSWRETSDAVAELFVSRAAALAALPVAPVFIASDNEDGEYDVVSVIPFTHVNRVRGWPLEALPEFRAHFSRMLPFFLAMGEDTDRHCENICRNAQNPEQFAEYDFESSSISLLLYKGSKDVPARKNKDILKLAEENHHGAGAPCLVREEFEKGVAILEKLIPSRLADIATLIDDEVGIPHGRKYCLLDYIETRRGIFMDAVQQGVFEPLMNAPAQSVNATVLDKKRSAKRFSFKL